MPIVAGIFYCIDHSPHTFNLLLTSDMSDNELLSTCLDTTLEWFCNGDGDARIV